MWSVVILLIFFMKLDVFAKKEHQSLSKTDITTWPKASSVVFGCFLEKEFKHKDKKFNCSLKKYINKGHPCFNTTEFYEGPQFPKQLTGEIHPKVEEVSLIWEKGRLQSVALTLKEKLPEKDVKSLFKLSNQAQVDECGKTNTCITLTGFEHTGSGDVECGDE